MNKREDGGPAFPTLATRLSPSDYAAKHGITLAYVWRLIRKGRLPVERVGGKQRYKVIGECVRRKYERV